MVSLTSLGILMYTHIHKTVQFSVELLDKLKCACMTYTVLKMSMGLCDFTALREVHGCLFTLQCQ